MADDTKSEVTEITETDDAEEELDLPELEHVSDALKERYEFTPQLFDEIVYRRPEDRVTSEVMSKFEYTEAISIRAQQLQKGGKPFTDVGELTDPLEIAEKEIKDKRCPLDVVRMITDKIGEKWHINELAIPPD